MLVNLLKLIFIFIFIYIILGIVKFIFMVGKTSAQVRKKQQEFQQQQQQARQSGDFEQESKGSKNKKGIIELDKDQYKVE